MIVKTESKTGNISHISGKVDFVNMSNGKAMLSIGGKIYPIDQLDSVIDDFYIIEQGLPKIEKNIKLEYDLANPKDLTFDVNLGQGDTIADNVAVKINGALLNSQFVSVSGNKVTISKDALQGVNTGNYKVAVVFNDPYYTTVSNKITLDITNTGTINQNPINGNPQSVNPLDQDKKDSGDDGGDQTAPKE